MQQFDSFDEGCKTMFGIGLVLGIIGIVLLVVWAFAAQDVGGFLIWLVVSIVVGAIVVFNKK